MTPIYARLAIPATEPLPDSISAHQAALLHRLEQYESILDRIASALGEDALSLLPTLRGAASALTELLEPLRGTGAILAVNRTTEQATRLLELASLRERASQLLSLDRDVMRGAVTTRADRVRHAQ